MEINSLASALYYDESVPVRVKRKLLAFIDDPFLRELAAELDIEQKDSYDRLGLLIFLLTNRTTEQGGYFELEGMEPLFCVLEEIQYDDDGFMGVIEYTDHLVMMQYGSQEYPQYKDIFSKSSLKSVEDVEHLKNALDDITRETEKVHHMELDQKWYYLIKYGRKTYEGRKLNDKNLKIHVGDTIIFNGDLKVLVTGVEMHNSIMEMLKSVGLRSILPGVKGYKDGYDIYANYYPEDPKMLTFKLRLV